MTVTRPVYYYGSLLTGDFLSPGQRCAFAVEVFYLKKCGCVLFLKMLSSLQEEDIDNELLIEEVEKSPALYAKKLKQYTGIILKRRLWDEIVLHLFPTRSFSQEQKENAGNCISVYYTLLHYLFIIIRLN